MLAENRNHGRFNKALYGIMLAFMLAMFGVVQSVNADSRQVPVLTIPDFTQIVDSAEGSVVNIRTTETIPVRRPGVRGEDPYELFRWFFGPEFAPQNPQNPHRRGPSDSAPEEERVVPRGVGSGFIISKDGYIITNNHVVAKSSDIFVTLTTGKEYKASIVGTDERTDIALLKIDADGLSPLPIGDSAKLKKGEWVLAIGSPFGLDSTVTSGIVSAINRDTGDYLPFIQTDVAVNPGNSGGPLLNLAGEVVGVNSQIISRSGGFMGISLAIPIDEAMHVVDQLKADGKVTRGRIGVQIGQVSDEVAKALNMDSTIGALVSYVEPNGPADKSGVRSGDVIIEFNGSKIKQMSDLPRIVGGTKPNTKASMKVWRKGKEVTLKVTVGEIAAPDSIQTADSSASETHVTDALGLRVRALSADTQKALGIDGGVEVVQVESPANRAGLAEGDIILMVNDQDIANTDQYAKVVSGLGSDKPAAVLVMRDNQSQWVALTPRK